METLEIERLIRLERYFRDTIQWAKWRECFHPDSSKTWINISWYKGEIDEWVQQSEKLAENGVLPLHTINPIDVRIKGNRAIAISSCQIVSRFEYHRASFDAATNMRAVSCFERVQGKWKMLSLEGIYLQDSIQNMVPGPVSAADFDMSRIKDLRSSYSCLIWNLERKGMKARRDLPGVDRPESVKEIMERVEVWLNEV